MSAFDIVSVNLQLRLGINGGVFGQQQVLVGLFGIGFLGGLLDQNAAMKHTLRAIIQNAIVILMTAAVWLRVFNDHVMVGQLLRLGQVEPIENALEAFAGQNSPNVIARET